ncbi:hypothetical protein RYX56_08990 [Alkalihalophilus lindianensis]|uniref:Uncharacterized protein n=1 Tax=Alkalihalophilus lindianensis TaxID=1630542 RepID=A0ABU3X9F5_9BACI|nr:hypothetical protein [Alkalihalophilus lindianensis]MDV2684504.1 hypothetical protein [Alkalihalophilus lindianensis]
MSTFSSMFGRESESACESISIDRSYKKPKQKACDCSIRIRSTDTTTVTAATFPGADVVPADVDIQTIDIDICPKCNPANSNVFAVFQNTFGGPPPTGFSTVIAASIPGTFKVKCSEETGMAIIEGLANIVIDNTVGLISPLVPITTILTLPFRIEVSSDGTATFTARFIADGETLSVSFAGLDVLIRDCDTRTRRRSFDHDRGCCE